MGGWTLEVRRAWAGVALFFELWRARPERLAQAARHVRALFPGVPHLGVDDLWERLRTGPGPILLDARTDEEFAVGHLPGAVRARSLDEAIAAIARREAGLPVVVYCSIGYRSGRLAQALRRAGREDFANLEGSLFAWANAGLPVVRNGRPVRAVHPFDARWGRYLEPSRRAPVAGTRPPAGCPPD